MPSIYKKCPKDQDLKADDVGRIVSDLFEDALASIFPLEHPTWTVTVHLPGGVLVAQDVVAHDRKDAFFKINKSNLFIQQGEKQIRADETE